MSMNILGCAAQSAKDALAPHRFVRREPRADDVVIAIPDGALDERQRRCL
jgi:uncharacterized zinc-type alcohol dehydrogenase-like protein